MLPDRTLDASAAEPRGWERVLDPIDRSSEILFGLIMALTFTGSISVAESGREEIRTILFATLGCNLAWGLVDAVMFLTNTAIERGHGLAAIHAVKSATSPAAAHQIIGDALPPFLRSLVADADLEKLRWRVRELTDLPRSVLTSREWLAAVAVFLLVFLSTFPLVVPFMLFDNVRVALRASNAIAVVMLFFTGYNLGAHGGYRPWRMGLTMVGLGLALVGITTLLGG